MSHIFLNLYLVFYISDRFFGLGNWLSSNVSEAPPNESKKYDLLPFTMKDVQ